ncbi:glutamate-rich protein 2 [Spea bombifrons]|uniref:glutamate-rich protein 2 n=1 Tax=Spea bombifrons TaxID=233779 RepID=UPI002349718E|nr:glutamate-rich protein 2 [Spea bombifrons]
MDSVDTRRVNPSIAKNQGPGRLEVLDQKDGFFTDTCLSGSQVRNSESQFCYDKHTTSHHVGKLEVLEPKEEIIYPTGSVPRPRSVVGRTGSPGKKCYTPNKQVSLCVLKPLPQSGDIYDAVEPILPRELDTSMTSVEQATTGSLSQSTQNRSIKNKSPDSSEEDESNDEREGAPTELLAEFLKAVMDKEYKVAQKLCRMILLYEPENTEAKAFSPLIEEMLQIGKH